MNRKIDLSESFEKSVSLIIEFVDEVQAEVTNIFEELEECNKENRYKLLNDISIKLQNEYNNSIIADLKIFINNNWIDTEYSFLSYCKRNLVGEDTENLAKRQEDYLKDKVNNIREVDIVKILNDQTIYERHDITKRLIEIEANTKKLENIYEDKKNEFVSLKNENEAIDMIEPIIVRYAGAISIFIEKCSIHINEIMDDNLSIMKKDSTETNEEFNDVSDQEIEDIADLIEGVKSHFISLMERE